MRERARYRLVDTDSSAGKIVDGVRIAKWFRDNPRVANAASASSSTWWRSGESSERRRYRPAGPARPTPRPPGCEIRSRRKVSLRSVRPYWPRPWRCLAAALSTFNPAARGARSGGTGRHSSIRGGRIQDSDQSELHLHIQDCITECAHVKSCNSPATHRRLRYLAVVEIV